MGVLMPVSYLAGGHGMYNMGRFLVQGNTGMNVDRDKGSMLG